MIPLVAPDFKMWMPHAIHPLIELGIILAAHRLGAAQPVLQRGEGRQRRGPARGGDRWRRALTDQVGGAAVRRRPHLRLMGTGPRLSASQLNLIAVSRRGTRLGERPGAVRLQLGDIVVPLRDAYSAMDGPILVMLATLIPVSDSLRRSGASDVLAGGLPTSAETLPAAGALTLILALAMAVTPFLNNAATVLVVAPIAASFAGSLGYRPEAFLMAVAIGAGCDFLTPIGHQCNTLVMGPGGYRFSDYPRLGLPLSLLVVVVAVPMLMLVWPLH